MSRQPLTAVLEPITQRASCIRLQGQRLPVWFLDEHDILLFDSGLASQRQALVECLEKNQLRPRALLTSHAHVDHTGNHAFLREKYGAKVWLTDLDAQLSATPEALMLLFPNVGIRSVMSVASDMLTECDERIPFAETELMVEGERIGVLPLPGHTPNHIGFVLPDGTAYLGDLLMSRRLLERTRFPFSLCWATDIKSKRKALQMNFPLSILAHNEVCQNVPALAEYNLRILRQQMQGLLDSMTPMDTLTDVIHRIYADHEGNHSDYDLLVINSVVWLTISGLVDLGCLSLSERHGAIHFLPTGKKVPSLIKEEN